MLHRSSKDYPGRPTDESSTNLIEVTFCKGKGHHTKWDLSFVIDLITLGHHGRGFVWVYKYKRHGQNFIPTMTFERRKKIRIELTVG